jgi:hypothetical protein
VKKSSQRATGECWKEKVIGKKVSSDYMNIPAMAVNSDFDSLVTGQVRGEPQWSAAGKVVDR